ncbi:uL15 family ribosomal protein, partial [Mycobacterium tuberculosis]|nr:uL15 family ribosomal protein [Mycobacterium tuberculosis]
PHQRRDRARAVRRQLMMVRAHGGLETIASAGHLMAIDAKKVPALASFPPAAVAAETMRADKTTYAVPFASQSMLVIYNKEIFDKNGIAVPASWDDLVKASQKLKAAGVIRRVKDGVRLLGPGELTKALTFEVAGASAPAAAAIEKAGGKLTVLAPKKAETEAA